MDFTKPTDLIIEPHEIPSIRLYMDQVTTFMEERLSPLKRREKDPILTKTMINNYAKAKLFPPPQKKLYTRNHLMLLILIYHLKGVLALGDIELLLSPVNTALTADKTSPAAADLYAAFVALQKGETPPANDPVLCALAAALTAAKSKRQAEQLLDASFAVPAAHRKKSQEDLPS